MISSHAKKMAQAQAQLNSRAGYPAPTPAGAATTTAPSTAMAGGRSGGGWFRSRWVTVPFLLAVLVGLWFGGVHVWNRWSESPQQTVNVPPQNVVPALPLASQPKEEWPMLVIPAGVGKKSTHIPVPFGMRVEFHGQEADVSIDCKYRNVRDEVRAPCPNGDMEFVYLTNLRADRATIVRYAYAPIRE